MAQQKITGSQVAPDTGWLAPSFVNGWSNYDGTWEQAGYLKDALGFVHLKGLIKCSNAGTGTIIFTLPAGYRPGQQFLVGVDGNNGGHILARLDFATNGNITANVSGNAYTSLSGITFKAEL